MSKPGWVGDGGNVNAPSGEVVWVDKTHTDALTLDGTFTAAELRQLAEWLSPVPASGFSPGRADCEDCLETQNGRWCMKNCAPGVTLGQHMP